MGSPDPSWIWCCQEWYQFIGKRLSIQIGLEVKLMKRKEWVIFSHYTSLRFFKYYFITLQGTVIIMQSSWAGESTTCTGFRLKSTVYFSELTFSNEYLIFSTSSTMWNLAETLWITTHATLNGEGYSPIVGWNLFPFLNILQNGHSGPTNSINQIV